MAEILTCTKCAKKLQVPEHFLGQTVQCPECGHQFVARQSAVSAAPLPSAAASGSARREARRYDDEEDDDDFDVRRRRRRDDDDDYPHYGAFRHDYVPHRGGLIMALGLVALVGGFSLWIPFLIGPVAWIMGSLDLRSMRDGHMDPAGESMTRSGQICGMIATVFLLLAGALLTMIIFAG